MKRKSLVVLLSATLVLLLIFNYDLNNKARIEKAPDFFVGIDVAYDDIVEIKSLIDEVSSYTNLFVIGSRGITHNTTKLDEICEYVYNKGLYFIVYMERPPRAIWLEDAKDRWGNRLLGFYAFDEPGGYQLDLNQLRSVQEADNYDDAANQFENSLNITLNFMTLGYTRSVNYPFFTSDYALYWFDYKGGYDVLLAQLGWNYSRQLNVALCRGASTVQNKDWGVIITWTYNNPPYIESGEELYNDLLLAYENGAKYLVVFDTNKNYTEGILKEEHLNALKQFWEYAEANPRTSESAKDRIAYVLPKNFAFGFRGPNDKIWGLWEANDLSNELCRDLNNLIVYYGTKLDIIYEDGLEPYNAYSEYVFWNGTIISDS